MKRIKMSAVIIFLGLIIGIVLWKLQHKPVSPIRIKSGQELKDTFEKWEKCTCGKCDMDIFSCDCPTAKSRREALKKKEVKNEL